MKRSYISSADLIIDHGEEIKELREKGATISKLVKIYGCSRNTMDLTLKKLGFTAPKWLEKDKE